MDIRTIKGIDDETWMRFKILAAKNRTTMGKLLGLMLQEYEKRKSEEFWNTILSGEKRVSDKEAGEMEKDVKNLRKERGFRHVSDF